MASEIKYGDHVSGGVSAVMANLVPSIVALVGLMIPILGIFTTLNYMAGIMAFKESGKAMEIGDLFNFDHLPNRLIGMIVYGVIAMIGMMLFFIPGLIFVSVTYFFPTMLAEKPDMPWADALKQSLAYGKQNLVPCLILAIVCGVCGMFFVTIPIAFAAQSLAYVAHKGEVAAATA